MNTIKKELLRFLVAGFSAVFVDLSTYYLLLKLLQHNSAKAISFILGTIVAYIINKYWTFEKKEKSYVEILRFVILYSITLGANVLVNKYVLNNTNVIVVAFLAATATSTVLNFIGQKFWVFK
ncbi:GtrA family protein [Flavobacterium phragmitis]|uniref:Putative flippase GtrA (Transmembrane translocase of bactoprenol-linked glucose) n=1 Tax=Flavobacterium phragmitis TaxID=739143 RepID=A0A1I1UZ84_9FLAO|nr:GtrA family protein [Flavobacterium phragmitis]SFD73340.1 Putative flippase GtrA (transmembrane translocase of bactoprenol-linked glucose) [Flavobacterium phragmitis]